MKKVMCSVLGCLIAVSMFGGCGTKDITVEEIDPGIENVEGISITEEGAETDSFEADEPVIGESNQDENSNYIEVADPYDVDSEYAIDLIRGLAGLESDETFVTLNGEDEKVIREYLQYWFMNQNDGTNMQPLEEGSNSVIYDDGRFSFVFRQDLWDMIQPDQLNALPASAGDAEYKIGLSGKGDKAVDNIVTFSITEGAKALKDMSEAMYAELTASGITDLNVVVDEENEVIVGMGVFKNPQTGTNCIATAMSGIQNGNTYLVLAITNPDVYDYMTEVQKIVATFVPF